MSSTPRRSIAAFLLVLFVLPAAAQAPMGGKGDSASPSPSYLWTLRNQCHEPLRVAVHYQQVEGRVLTQGWWSVAPRDEIRIGMRSEWIGYFAVSASENLFWWNPEGPKFGIDRARNFEYPGDGQRQGATVTGFHWISVIREPVTTLSCR